MFAVFKAQESLFGHEPMAIAAACIATPAFGPCNADAVQRVGKSALGVLARHKRIVGTRPENPRPDTHTRSSVLGARDYDSGRVTIWCISLKTQELMPMGGKGRWEGSPHRRPERRSLTPFYEE
jgi:hypothetical protein